MSITQTISTEIGELEYVRVTDEGFEDLSGKFKFTANLVVPSNSPIISEIDKFWKKFKPDNYKRKPRSLGYYPHRVRTDERDEDGEFIWEETDKVFLRFKTNTTYPGGSPKRIKIYDAYANEAKIPDNVIIGNGSIGKISGAMGIYINKPDAGVSLYLDAIQIIKLVKYQPLHGFTEVKNSEVEVGDGYFMAGEEIPF